MRDQEFDLGAEASANLRRPLEQPSDPSAAFRNLERAKQALASRRMAEQEPVLYPLADTELLTFADRLDWIVAEDYEDEGASAILPIRQLASLLRALEGFLGQPSLDTLLELAKEYTKLNQLR